MKIQNIHKTVNSFSLVWHPWHLSTVYQTIFLITTSLVVVMGQSKIHTAQTEQRFPHCYNTSKYPYFHYIFEVLSAGNPSISHTGSKSPQRLSILDGKPNFWTRTRPRSTRGSYLTPSSTRERTACWQSNSSAYSAPDCKEETRYRITSAGRIRIFEAFFFYYG